MPAASLRPHLRLPSALLLVFLFTASWRSPAAEEAGLAPANAAVISLPPLIVEEKSKPLAWRYLGVPGLEILSLCTDGTTLDFARRHHRLEEMLGALVPARFLFKSSIPETHILFNQEVGRARSQEIIADLLRQSGAQATATGLAPAERRGGPAPSVHFLPNMRMWDLDATTVFAVIDEANDAAAGFTFTAERIAFLLERRTPALPHWFTEGTLAVFGRARFDSDQIVIAPAGWTSDAERMSLLLDPEFPRTLLPLPEMLARSRPTTGAALTAMDRVWRAQCGLFVQWAFADKSGTRRDALWKFVDRLEREPLTEALFREHFGLDFAAARDRLSDYLEEAFRTEIKLAAPKAGPVPRFRMRPPTDLEVARIRGGWERMEIAYVKKRYPDIASRYVDQARHTLHRAYDRGERDPALLAELGLTEVDGGNPGAAREFLARAVQGGLLRPRVAYEFSRLAYQSFAPTNATRFTTGQTAELLAPLLAVRHVAPPLAESYVLMSDIWVHSAAQPSAADLAALADGVEIFPSITPFVLRVVHLHAAAGQRATALTLADLGIRHARDPALRELLARMRTEIAEAKN